ncbi:MAG TPA: ABC-F family ATP-binding cassette domain-containing protein [Verrucomicrobiota bacterium]|nr:ABC-F family ATP-binding cassette domain-containing protein [Verrucomicrobiota bacterium]HRZ36606.1 ABC-F family ATP-binding cassette domain-containing protein [Candidatus Paceibacterota bacterium]
MLSLSEVSKAYAGRTLFADVSLQVNREDRLGLVGPNGAGKSTLLGLILGTTAPDTGTIALQRGITVGYLPQENAPIGDETVLELASAITPEIGQLRRQLRAFAEHAADTAEYHDAQARFDQLGGSTLEAKAKKVLAGLSFRPADFERPASALSGGWVMRAYLARLLTLGPDLLLLDEPTNHLDLEALLWFQEYLRGYPGAMVLISHDREFLNQLTTSILEIRQGRLFRYRGNYDTYLDQRAANEAQLLAAWKHQQREIARLQAFVDRFRAKNTKAAQAQSKLKQIERMVKLEAPSGAEATVDFAFPQPRRSGQRVVALEGVRFAYGEQLIYDNLDFEAERGRRIVLVGPNGAGKSTLLKLLAGVLAPQAGERRLGHNVSAGYYSQYRVDTLHLDRTVLDEAFDTPQALTETFVRTVLGSFLFRGDDVFKRVGVLSGGEKSRLALVKLLLDPPNLLLMDEPTTHLDLASVEALLSALQQFDGTIVFISHDVYFIHQLANHVVHVHNGRLTAYPGDYRYYVDKTAALRAPESGDADSGEGRAPSTQEAGTSVAGQRREQKRLAAQERQARYRELQSVRQRVRQLEQDIAAGEARQAELTAALEDPDTYADSSRAVALNREITGVISDLERLTADWETAATRLHEFEGE